MKKHKTLEQRAIESADTGTVVETSPHPERIALPPRRFFYKLNGKGRKRSIVSDHVGLCVPAYSDLDVVQFWITTVLPQKNSDGHTMVTRKRILTIPVKWLTKTSQEAVLDYCLRMSYRLQLKAANELRVFPSSDSDDSRHLADDDRDVYRVASNGFSSENLWLVRHADGKGVTVHLFNNRPWTAVAPTFEESLKAAFPGKQITLTQYVSHSRTL